MLKKTNRIQLKKDFSKIFREGKRVNTDFLFFRILKTEREDSRFGFVISKRISKNSTARNKIKRILSETVRKNLPKIKKGTDVVIIVKSDFSKENSVEADGMIKAALKKSLLLG